MPRHPSHWPGPRANDPYAAVRFLQSMATYAELPDRSTPPPITPRLSRHPSQSAAAHRTGRGPCPPVGPPGTGTRDRG